MKPLLLVALLIAGCVKADPTPRFTPAWEPFDPSTEGWIETRKALLCSDCQFHNLYSRPLPERNLSAEAAAATAIRPPQLDLFAPDVLRWILENGAKDEDVVLHLGDALNLATTGEFHDFVEVMDGAGKPWFMAPGNHDVYYFGVYVPERPELPLAAAYESGEPMDKAHFIRLYVAALLRQGEPGCAAFAAALGIEPDKTAPLEEVAQKIPASFEWIGDGDAKNLLHAICWEIDAERTWRSYILQSIDMSEEGTTTRALMLDSCQYSRRPTMAPNAWSSYPVSLNCGLTGEMLPNQLRKIRQWLTKASGSHGSVFLSHHPFEHLSPPTKTNLGWLWREYQVGMMVTAHTHAGYFAHHDLGGEMDQIELNIGSTTDWPMEWRTLQGFVNVEKKKIYLRTERSTLVEALRKAGGFFERGWEIPRDAPDDYRAYKQGEAASNLLVSYYVGFHYTPEWLPEPKVRATKPAIDTEEDVKTTLLWTYHRLVNTFPTDPEKTPEWPSGCASDADVMKRIEDSAGESGTLDEKIALLMELAVFEKSRHSRDPEGGASTDEVRTRYKISQAAWASRFMAAKGRRLRIEDELIGIDWGGSATERLVEKDKLAEKAKEAEKK